MSLISEIDQFEYQNLSSSAYHDGDAKNKSKTFSTSSFPKSMKCLIEHFIVELEAVDLQGN